MILFDVRGYMTTLKTWSLDQSVGTFVGFEKLATTEDMQKLKAFVENCYRFKHGHIL